MKRILIGLALLIGVPVFAQNGSGAGTYGSVGPGGGPTNGLTQAQTIAVGQNLMATNPVAVLESKHATNSDNSTTATNSPFGKMGNASTADTNALSAFGKPIEKISGQAAVPLWRDEFSSTNAAYVSGNTIPFADNSGVYWTCYSDSADSGFHVQNGELCLSNSTAANLSTVVITNLPVAGTNVAGYTIIARVVMGPTAYNNNSRVYVGWTTNANATPASLSKKMPICGISVSGFNLPHAVENLTADGTEGAALFTGALKNNEDVLVAVKATVNGCLSYIQGSFASQLGCYIGSHSWFPIGSVTNIIWTTNILPIISQNFGYTACSSYISDVKVLTDFDPGTEAQMLCTDLTNGIARDVSIRKYGHAPYCCMDSTGHKWATWQMGTGDVGTNVDVYAAYQKSDGTFYTQLVIPFVGGQDQTRYNAGSVWTNLTGQVVMTYNKTTDAWTNPAVQYRVLSWSGSNITVGAETAVSITNVPAGSFTMSYSPAIVSAAGTLLFPVMLGTNGVSQTLYTNFVARSLDNGTNWALSTNGITHVSLPQYEGQLAIEPDGTLAQYIRQDSTFPVAYYQRSVSPNDGRGWLPATSTAIPSNSRGTVSKMPDGNLLICGYNNLSGGTVRYPLTAWIIGNGGTILQPIPILDYKGANFVSDNFQYSWAGYFNNKICLIFNPINEFTVWYDEISLDGTARNMAIEQQKKNQRFNGAIHQ